MNSQSGMSAGLTVSGMPHVSNTAETPVARVTKFTKLEDFDVKGMCMASIYTGEIDLQKTYRENRAEADAAFECALVRTVLEKTKGNVSAAARLLNMDRKHLRDLSVRHGLLRCLRGDIVSCRLEDGSYVAKLRNGGAS